MTFEMNIWGKYGSHTRFENYDFKLVKVGMGVGRGLR
jgi:hypothetical protein